MAHGWAFHAVLLACVIFLVEGCGLAETPFAREAGDAGSTLSAAANTLAYGHDGKLTDSYVTGSFVNYQELLAGIDQTLPSLSGAPDDATVQRLIDLYHAAEPALSSPCVSDECDWRGQIDALQAASDAFREASEGSS